MPFRFVTLCVGVLLACAGIVRGQAPSPHVAATEPLSPAEQQRRFRVPPGFEVQLVAAEPEIRKPINLNFDARGRLFVTQSIEYPNPAPLDTPGKDEVRVLADFDPQGRARKASTYADGLNIPIGVLPLSDGAIVYSIPNLYRLYDRDGDGKAESREVLYREFGFRDTHGMCSSLNRWIDGWVYACHGFSNTSTVAGADGQAITMQSGHTFRLRDDGSHVELFTQGQVNPFGMCFDPHGNVYVADCHSRPVTMLLRGACYPSFGKPHDGLGFGPDMIRHNHGSTGIAGVVYYEAEQFPAEYRRTMFIGNPITNRINHDRLEQHGSTYKAVESADFVTCDDPWFRPVDIKLGPDGALYIADFYNRIIGHYEVPLDHPGRDRERGRIWRVIYRGEQAAAPAVAPVDLTSLPLDVLIARLGDANLTLRTLATHEIVDRFANQAAEPVAAMLASSSHGAQRAHGLWVLQRLGRLPAAELLRLTDADDPLVRVQALKALAQRADWMSHDDAFRQAARLRLDDADPFVRRAAVEALGEHPDKPSIDALLALWDRTDEPDTHLVHSIRLALRNHLLPPDAHARLAEKYADQPAARRHLLEASLGARTEASAGFVLACLGAIEPNDRALADYVHFAARYLPEAELPQLYRICRQAKWREHTLVLRALHRAAQERGTTLPAEVLDAVGRVAERRLAVDSEAAVRQGLELARDFRLPALFELTTRHVSSSAPHAGLRLTAIEAAAATDPTACVALLAAPLADAQEDFAVRQKIAQTLGQIGSTTAHQVLAQGLAAAPARVATEIALALAHNQQGGETLLKAIESGKASPHLLSEPGVHFRLAIVKPADWQSRRERLLAALPPRDQRIKELVELHRAGFQKAHVDLAAGQRIFQKTCAACHRLAEQGTKVGPELDGIGHRGLERLLEDVLDPNRNVDQAFRSTILTTTDGRALTGLALADEGQVLVLVDPQGKPQRIASSEIAERAISPLSPMPANVAEALKPDELYHLLGYLLSQRQPNATTP